MCELYIVELIEVYYRWARRFQRRLIYRSTTLDRGVSGFPFRSIVFTFSFLFRFGLSEGFLVFERVFSRVIGKWGRHAVCGRSKVCGQECAQLLPSIRGLSTTLAIYIVVSHFGFMRHFDCAVFVVRYDEQVMFLIVRLRWVEGGTVRWMRRATKMSICRYHDRASCLFATASWNFRDVTLSTITLRLVRLVRGGTIGLFWSLYGMATRYVSFVYALDGGRLVKLFRGLACLDGGFRVLYCTRV